MFAINRREKIQQIVMEKGSVKTTELCDLLGASPSTVRNDLNYMARQGLIQKVHGGAARIVEQTNSKSETVLIPDYIESNHFRFQRREMQHKMQKEAIANVALSYIRDNQCILLDASSTTLTLAKKLLPFNKLLVVTNGIYTMFHLKDAPNVDTVIIGGFVSKTSGFVEGVIGADILNHLNVDIAFVSANGFTEKEGLTDFDIYEVELKKCMLERCKHIVAMLDSSKLERVSSSSFLPAEKIDVLLTDDKIDARLLRKYQKSGINVRICPCNDEEKRHESNE